ncbi:branched-chain amino acid ABC transporter permease [Ancylobacter sp. MQZ15Z-1]|uniref:Branched-chain amino acid ABC transporter permease n=1 Tax=Ancylobacter mangrovi TaxID=2972472 RepID=A0A9X2P955_9HYPH|nr:branched-chain amino acid ABC transporter permease [Ancylobacter mangrovi]MCS0493660.1 branched-chain amino acid ABC transporter permease [Ancylobacter mangrovi]
MKPLAQYAAIIVGLVLLGTTPLYADNYILRTAATVAMYGALATSWNFIGGFTGYPSFSTAAFFGLGAYVGTICQRNGIPMGVAWTIATVSVAAFAALLGGIILRLRGHYFAIGSIAIVELCRLIVSSWSDLTGGGDGLNVPLIHASPDAVTRLFLFVMLGILAASLVVTIIVDRSRLGFGLRCIHQNEDAAAMVGINTTAYKIAAYTLSAVFCATVGAAYASWTGYIDPTDSFQIVMTVKVAVMAILGGAGTVVGPALGAAAFVLLEEVFWANFIDWNRAILGVVIVLLIFFLPGGLLSLRARLRRASGGAA